MLLKLSALYSLFVGFSILGMWAMFYFSSSIPELATEPTRIWMHLIAEILTAIALIFAGWCLLKQKPWGKNLYFLSTGALIYTLIQSSGYFMQSGDFGFVLMFGILLLLSFAFLIKNLKD
jgi:hypothetical protein